MRRICRGRAPIDAYGKGGFRFAGMSHRGSLLCLPDGIWAWPVASVRTIERDRARAGVRRARDARFLPDRRRRGSLAAAGGAARSAFATLSLSVDAMPTGAAVRTYNILLAKTAASARGLIAVE